MPATRWFAIGASLTSDPAAAAASRRLKFSRLHNSSRSPRTNKTGCFNPRTAVSVVKSGHSAASWRATIAAASRSVFHWNVICPQSMWRTRKEQQQSKEKKRGIDGIDVPLAGNLSACGVPVSAWKPLPQTGQTGARKPKKKA